MSVKCFLNCNARREQSYLTFFEKPHNEAVGIDKDKYLIPAPRLRQTRASYNSHNIRYSHEKLKRYAFFDGKYMEYCLTYLDRDSKPLSFQEMLRNSTKYCLKLLLIKEKRNSVRIISVLVNLIRFRRF